MKDYSLTDAQEKWFDERFKSGSGQRSIPAGTEFYHGDRKWLPHLTNGQSLWLAEHKEVATGYSMFGGTLNGAGVLHLRTKAAMSLPNTKIDLVSFVGKLDDGSWGLDHDHFSRRLAALRLAA